MWCGVSLIALCHTTCVVSMVKLPGTNDRLCGITERIIDTIALRGMIMCGINDNAVCYE